MSSARVTRNAVKAVAAEPSPVEVSPANVVTPKKNKKTKKKQTSPKEPKKQKGATNYTHFYFEMIDDMEDAFFSSVKQANIHRDEFADFIVNEKKFATAKAYYAFKKKHGDPILAPKPAADKKNNSKVAAAVASLMSNDTNTNRFHGFYKTTATSSQVVVIICAKNEWDSHAWQIKAEFLAEICCNSGKVMQLAQDLKDGLVNMKHAKASDPDDPDKTKPSTTTFTPKNDLKKTITIYNHRLVTFLPLPHEAFATNVEEDEFINGKVTRFLKSFRNFMASEQFTEVLQQVGKARKPDCVEKLFQTKAKTNLPKFLNSAVVKATKCEFLTDHLTKGEVTNIMRHLWSTRYKTSKYTGSIKEENEDEADDIQQDQAEEEVPQGDDEDSAASDDENDEKDSNSKPDESDSDDNEDDDDNDEDEEDEVGAASTS